MTDRDLARIKAASERIVACQVCGKPVPVYQAELLPEQDTSTFIRCLRCRENARLAFSRCTQSSSQ